MMAIFLPSSIIGAVSGSIGSTTLKLTKTGGVIASRILKRNAPSQAQNLARTKWNTLLRSWQDLTTIQRQSWNAAAVDVTRTNRLAITREISGFQFFTQHNSPALTVGVAIEQDPPQLQITNPVVNPEGFAFVGGPVAIQFDLQSIVTPSYVLVEGSRPFANLNSPSEPETESPLTWPFKSWRILDSFLLNNGIHGFPLTDPFRDAFGLPLETENIAYRVRVWHPTAQASKKVIIPAVTVVL